jgi:ABC-type transport system involved in cytochrome bd biosynthesis fused ATPase/permease subunit
LVLEEESEMPALDAFLENSQHTSSTARSKLAIVLAVIDAKRKDIKAREAEAMRQQLRNKLQEALAAKENDFSGKSAEELRAMLQDVEGLVSRG